MIHSQEVALRCAAAMPVMLLAHRQIDPRREFIKDKNSPLARIRNVPFRQIEACKDDAARRLITGRSQ